MLVRCGNQAVDFHAIEVAEYSEGRLLLHLGRRAGHRTVTLTDDCAAAFWEFIGRTCPDVTEVQGPEALGAGDSDRG